MPHIRVIFVDHSDMRSFLMNFKKGLRHSLAKVTGYELGAISLIPEPIRFVDMELADNVLPLEFVIDVGTRVGTTEAIEKCSAAFKERIVRDFPFLAEINFGVWMRSFLINEFVEHKPE